MADVYEHPTAADLAVALDAMAAPASRTNRSVRPVPLKTQIGQVAFTIPLRTLAGLRWLTLMAAVNNVAVALWQLDWLPTVSWGWVVARLVAARLAAGPDAAGRGGCPLLLRGVTPGSYPRGGKVHLRLWLAERLADEMGAANLAGAAWIRHYARALGARVGTARRPALDPAGDRVARSGGRLLGRAGGRPPRVTGSTATCSGSAASTSAPTPASAPAACWRRARRSGAGAEVAPGSAVFGEVPAGEAWSGAPAQRAGAARGPWEDERPAHRPGWAGRRTRPWPRLIACLPLLAVLAGLAVARAGAARRRLDRRGAPRPRWRCCPCPWSVAAVAADPVRVVAGPAALDRARGGSPPGARAAGAGRPGPCCGSSTRRGPGSSRCTRAR